MATALDALNKMAEGKANMPDIRKITKINKQVASYMKDVQVSQK